MAISVTKLSEYAENPSDFVKRKGAPISAKAAQYGKEKHNNTGGRGYAAWLLVIVLACLLAVAKLWF